MGLFFKPRLNFCLMKSLETSAKCLFLFFFFSCNCFCLHLFLPAHIYLWLAFLPESQYVLVCGALVTVVSIWGETRALSLEIYYQNQNQYIF